MMTRSLTARSGLRRTVVSVVLMLLILSAAYGVFRVMLNAKPTAEAREIVPTTYNVDVFTVTPLNFTELLTAFGTARADREVVLAAQVTGEIVEVHPSLKVGRHVAAGRIETSREAASRQVDPEILLRIDPRDFQQRVDLAKNSISSAETEIRQLNQQKDNAQRQLDLAKTDLTALREEYERVRKVLERNAGSASELTRSLLEVRRYEDTIVQLENQISLIPHQLEMALQRLSSSQSELERAENDLARTTVVPPFSGSLSEVLVEQGQYVRAGEPLVRLVDSAKIEIPVSMGLEDYLLVQHAIIEGNFPLALLSEHETAPPRWTGRVVRVSPEADAKSRTVEVFIEVINSEQSQPLLPGTFVFAAIEGPQYRNRHLVPREAMTDKIVYVVDQQNHARPRTLTTGRRLKSLITVEDGLVSGDRVILTNLDIVRDGTQVTPRAHTSAPDEIQKMKSPILRIDDGSVAVP